MNRNKKMMLPLIILLTVSLSIAGCGWNPILPWTPSPPPASATPAAPDTDMDALDVAEQPLYRMNVFSQLSNYTGEQTGWFAKVIKDELNIELNIIASNLDGGANRFATLMASRDLGDLVVFGNDGQDYRDAITAGLLLDWTQDGLLEEHAANILALVPLAIEKNRVNFGNGTSVYGIGHNSSYMELGPSEGQDMTWHPDIRWDLYQQLGMPEINQIEDFLPVLKAMQELEPYNESNQPVYGFSMWADWDVDKMTLAKQFANMYGYDENGFILYHAIGDHYEDILDENGWYLRTLRLYYTANQMGIVDPDSISQTFSDATGKIRDGRVLFSWFPWLSSSYNTPERTSQGKGFALVPAKDQKVLSFSYDPYGGNRVWAIGSKAEYPDRVMALIDWLYTPEGLMISHNGPQGLTWDVQDGKPVVTDFGWKCFEDGSTVIPEKFGGGIWTDGSNQINNGTIQLTSLHPSFGEPFDHHLWESTLERNPSKLVEDWRAAMGAMTPKQYLLDNNMITLSVPHFSGVAPEVMNAALEQKFNQVSTVIKQYSWQMIFARNETEFDKLKSQMIDMARGLGYDEVAAWQMEQAMQMFAVN